MSEWRPPDMPSVAHQPVPRARQRLLAALSDLATVFLLCSPLLVRGFLNLQDTLRSLKPSCAGEGSRRDVRDCLTNGHITLVEHYAATVFVIVAGIGLCYFAILQSGARRRTVGEWLAGVLLVAVYPPSPPTRPSFRPPLIRFAIGLGLCAPIYLTGLELWLEPNFGLFLLAIFCIAGLGFSRQIVRAFRPEEPSGAMPWDRWTDTVVIAHGRPRIGGQRLSKRDPVTAAPSSDTSAAT